MSSSSDAGVRWIILCYHDFCAGTFCPSQPGLALTGRVEARLLYDLYSVYGGVKLLWSESSAKAAKAKAVKPVDAKAEKASSVATKGE